MTDGNWEPTRWWRAIDARGEMWAESSDADEIREAAEEIGGTVEHCWMRTEYEWRRA